MIKETTLKRLYRQAIVLLGIMSVAFGLAACSSPASAATAPTCFTQLSQQQEQQIQQYTAQQGGQLTSQTANSNGTQDICVLQPNGNGGYDQHYYNQQDGLANYWMYALMFGHSQSLADYGLITGQLSPLDYIMLTSLSGVNRNGGFYHPYGYSSGRWQRESQPVIINHVTVVQYGSRPPVSYSKASSVKPPRGYARTRGIPRSNGEVANASKASNGRYRITPTKRVVSSSGGARLSPTKKAPAGSTYRNPSRGTSSGYKIGSTKSGSSFHSSSFHSSSHR